MVGGGAKKATGGGKKSAAGSRTVSRRGSRLELVMKASAAEAVVTEETASASPSGTTSASTSTSPSECGGEENFGEGITASPARSVSVVGVPVVPVDGAQVSGHGVGVETAAVV